MVGADSCLIPHWTIAASSLSVLPLMSAGLQSRNMVLLVQPFPLIASAGRLCVNTNHRLQLRSILHSAYSLRPAADILKG